MRMSSTTMKTQSIYWNVICI